MLQAYCRWIWVLVGDEYWLSYHSQLQCWQICPNIIQYLNFYFWYELSVYLTKVKQKQQLCKQHKTVNGSWGIMRDILPIDNYHDHSQNFRDNSSQLIKYLGRNVSRSQLMDDHSAINFYFFTNLNKGNIQFQYFNLLFFCSSKDTCQKRQKF